MPYQKSGRLQEVYKESEELLTFLRRLEDVNASISKLQDIKKRMNLKEEKLKTRQANSSLAKKTVNTIDKVERIYKTYGLVMTRLPKGEGKYVVVYAPEGKRRKELVKGRVDIERRLKLLEEERVDIYRKIDPEKIKTLIEGLNEEKKRIEDQQNIDEEQLKAVLEKIEYNRKICEQERTHLDVLKKFGIPTDRAVEWYVDGSLQRICEYNPRIKEIFLHIEPYLKHAARMIHSDDVEKFYLSLLNDSQENRARIENLIKHLENGYKLLTQF